MGQSFMSLFSIFFCQMSLDISVLMDDAPLMDKLFTITIL